MIMSQNGISSILQDLLSSENGLRVNICKFDRVVTIFVFACDAQLWAISNYIDCKS